MDDNGAKKSFSFQMQIGLTRDQINIDGELTLTSLKEIACSFVDRKVSACQASECWICKSSVYIVWSGDTPFVYWNVYMNDVYKHWQHFRL